MDQLPRDVIRVVRGLVGPFALAPSSGLSRSRVFRVIGRSRDVGVKLDASTREFHFLTEHAEPLRAAGVDSARLLAHGGDESAPWLVLEWIEAPLPRERWGPDPEVLGLLASLHGATRPTDPDQLFLPRWSTEMTARARSRVTSVRDESWVAVERAREIALPLLESRRSLVSADTNPMNWAMRADGSPVLLDWERFGRSAPEIDVAILVPGLPAIPAFVEVASAYARAAGLYMGGEELVARLVACKAWSVVELLASEVLTEQKEIRARLANAFPLWVSGEDVQRVLKQS